MIASSEILLNVYPFDFVGTIVRKICFDSGEF
jgi:hypothetical protein